MESWRKGNAADAGNGACIMGSVAGSGPMPDSASAKSPKSVGLTKVDFRVGGAKVFCSGICRGVFIDSSDAQGDAGAELVIEETLGRRISSSCGMDDRGILL